MLNFSVLGLTIGLASRSSISVFATSLPLQTAVVVVANVCLVRLLFIRPTLIRVAIRFRVSDLPSIATIAKLAAGALPLAQPSSASTATYPAAYEFCSLGGGVCRE